MGAQRRSKKADLHSGTIANRQRRTELRAPLCDSSTIYIPANLAFGTGEHATTAGCLRLLADIAPKKGDWEFLDAGTGTGILAIAALRLGASRVLGFDFDATAIRVAKANAHLNKADGLKLFRADVLKYRPEGSFDVVAANLYGDLFRKAASRLWPAIKLRGRLIISGLMRDQVERVSEKIHELRGQIEIKRTRGKWVTMLAQRTENSRAGVTRRPDFDHPLFVLSNSLVEKTEWHM